MHSMRSMRAVCREKQCCTAGFLQKHCDREREADNSCAPSCTLFRYAWHWKCQSVQAKTKDFVNSTDCGIALPMVIGTNAANCYLLKPWKVIVSTTNGTRFLSRRSTNIDGTLDHRRRQQLRHWCLYCTTKKNPP